MNPEHQWFVIVNPTAGVNRAAKQWPQISKMLTDAGLEHQHAFTQRGGHAALLARNAIREGYRKIITVGGDGTNNEVINGIMKQKVVPTNEIIYSIIAMGTGNDWTKTHKIPRNTKKAIECIKAGKTTYQDIGIATYDNNGQNGQRYFVNVAGMSYDAFVTKTSNERRNFVTNQLFYIFLVFACLYKFKPRKAKVLFDGQEIEGDFYTVNIGLCKYSGGGMQFVPHAEPNDGLFALTVAKDVTKTEVILNTHRFYNGKIGDHPKIHTHQAESIRVEASNDKPTLLELDGEYVGNTPAEFTLLKSALKIVVLG